jgi:hypothetical protein
VRQGGASASGPAASAWPRYLAGIVLFSALLLVVLPLLSLVLGRSMHRGGADLAGSHGAATCFDASALERLRLVFERSIRVERAEDRQEAELVAHEIAEQLGARCGGDCAGPCDKRTPIHDFLLA